MRIVFRKLLSRRRFVKGVSLLGLSALVAPLAACGSSPGAESNNGSSGDPDTFPLQVYRFQTRGTYVCTACRNHARYKVFLDEATADANRAHGGCNCSIVTQPITAEYWQMVSPYEVGGVIELRQIYA